MNKTKLKRVFYVILSSMVIPLAIMFLLSIYGSTSGYEQQLYSSWGISFAMAGTMIVIIPYNIIGIILVLIIPVKEKKQTLKEGEKETLSEVDKTNINSKETTLVTETKVEKIEKPNENTKFYKQKTFVISVVILSIILFVCFVGAMDSQRQKNELMEQVKNDKIPDQIMNKLKSEEESNGLKKGSYFKSFKIKEDTIRQGYSVDFEIVVNGNSENDEGMYLTVYCDKDFDDVNETNKIPKLYISTIYPHDKIWNEMKQLKGKNNDKSNK